MIWASIVKFFADNPIARWVAGIIVLALGWEAVKRNLKDAGRKAERDANAIKQAKVESQIIATITENSNEMVRQSDTVRSHTAAEQLPDGQGASLPAYHYRD